MRLIFPATDNTIESYLDHRFGRCNYFIVIDIQNNEIKEIKAIENKAKYQNRGAGVMAAETIINLKPDILFISKLGPRAHEIIDRLDVKVDYKQGLIKDIIQDYLN